MRDSRGDDAVPPGARPVIVRLDTAAVERVIQAVVVLGALTVVVIGSDASTDDTSSFGEWLLALSPVIVPGLLLIVVANVVALHVSFYETRLVRERGWWPFKRTIVVEYASITRVRASDTRGVTIGLDDGKTYKIADPFLTQVRGSLPEVDLNAGEHAAPMLRMRRIARFIELAVEKASAAAG